MDEIEQRSTVVGDSVESAEDESASAAASAAQSRPHGRPR